MTFADDALRWLPPPPARVLEVGCGDSGGATPALLAAGYDVLAIDPRAPEGPAYRRIALEQLDDPGPFDAIVAGRVLHHLEPLQPSLDRLAALAPLLIVDELAWDRIDGPSQAWYEARYRERVEAGEQPHAPPSIDEWRERHPGLHPFALLEAELDARWTRLELAWRPYFHRWLEADLEAREQAAIAAGEIRAIGVRYVGSVRAHRSAERTRSTSPAR